MPGRTDGGVIGVSVKSIEGEANCKLVISAVESVKITASSVFISGPAGYQNSEHAPDAVCVSHFCGFAWASCTAGRWKLLDIGPVRLTSEKATENTMMSFRPDSLFRISHKKGPLDLIVKSLSEIATNSSISHQHDVGPHSNS